MAGDSDPNTTDAFVFRTKLPEGKWRTRSPSEGPVEMERNELLDDLPMVEVFDQSEAKMAGVSGGTNPIAPGESLAKLAAKQCAAEHYGGRNIDSAAIPVTPEMAAAVEEFNCYFEADPPVFFGIVKDIYRAMHVAAPVELVSAVEDAMHAARQKILMLTGSVAWREERMTTLAGERDYWKGEADRLANGPPTQHPPEFVAKILMDREGRRDDPMALARLTEVIRCARLDGRKQARDAEVEMRAAYDYLRRVFEHVAPQCTPLDDLMGICIQVDNALAGAIRLEAENAILRDRLASLPAAESPDYIGPTAPDGAGIQRSIPDVVHERVHETVKDILAGRVLPGARKQVQEALKNAPKDAAPLPGRAFAEPGDPRRMGLA